MVPLTTVDTKNILFICGGAFPDLENIIKERLNKQASIGFFADLKDKYDHDANILDKVIVDDLKKFGMIPEFLGRLPIIFTLSGLTEEMLVQILKEPKNAILKQYQKLLALDEVKLEFDDGALVRLRRWPWRNIQAPEPCARSWRNICWISCMRFQRMRISGKS